MTKSAAPAALPVLHIGLLWHSVNSGNLGVGALTIGNIALLRRAAAIAGITPQFHILGFADPGRTVYVHGPDIEVLSLNGRAFLPGGAFGRAIARCDVVLDIGGGDSFTDIYGWKRLAYLTLSKWVTIRSNRPLLFSPQTIGPFTNPLARRFAGWLMTKAERVFVRDPQSFDAATMLAPGARIIQSTDVAFAMPYEPAPVGQRRRRIGVNVSGLLFTAAERGDNPYGLEIDYARYTRALLDDLCKRPDLEVQLICHVVSQAMPHDDDDRVAAALAREYPAAVRPPAFAGPVAAKSWIAQLDFLIAARMHACIAAYSTGVPVVPVAYSRKFAGLFGGVLDYPIIVPVRGMTTDDAVAYTLDSIDNHARLARDIARGSEAVAALLDHYVTKVAQIFSALSQRN